MCCQPKYLFLFFLFSFFVLHFCFNTIFRNVSGWQNSYGLYLIGIGLLILIMPWLTSNQWVVCSGSIAAMQLKNHSDHTYIYKYLNSLLQINPRFSNKRSYCGGIWPLQTVLSVHSQIFLFAKAEGTCSVCTFLSLIHCY